MATRPLIKECLQMLNVCGVNPVNQNKWSKVRAIGTLMLLTHLTSSLMLQIVLNEKGWTKMETIALCVGLMVIYKISSSIIQRKKFTMILKDMEQFFTLGDLEVHVQQSLKDTLKSATQVFKFFVGIVLLALSIFLITPLLTSTRSVPFDMHLPNNFHPPPYYYHIMYLVQVVDSLLACTGMVGFDGVFAAFIIYVTCELKILKRKLSTVNINVNISGDDEHCLKEISQLVDHHNFILRCIKKLNQLYATELLVQFSVSIPLTCVGLFYMAVDRFPPPLVELFQFTPYLIAVLMQLFIYCLGGTYLINETESVAQAVYESDWWTKTQPKFRKVCVLIIQRANRAERLTAGGMFILNLESFTKIIKFALSFFSMAKAMYGRCETEYTIAEKIN